MEESQPYERRETAPYFFYPMFHPQKHLLSREEISMFCRRLEETPAHHKRGAIYIHIPFCDSFCHMCACYKTHTPKDKTVFERYVQALKTEMAYYSKAPYVQSLYIDFIYFGGGTPSTLPPDLIEETIRCLKESFALASDTTITFEGDVRTLKDKQRLEKLKRSGCNRISFGVQSLDKEVRKRSGLVPTRSDIQACIDALREFGYPINFDLMFGLPGQDLAVWKKDLNAAVILGADGLDLYETVLYPTTKLFRRRHKAAMAHDRERTDMLKFAIDFIKGNGYVQRTKAIFQKPANRLKRIDAMYHANQDDIISMGDSAIGLINGMAYRNRSPLAEYLAWGSEKTSRLPIRLGFHLSQRQRFTRYMTQLPKLLKIDKASYPQVIAFFRKALDNLLEKKLIEENEATISLTDEGKLWTDNIISDFISFRDKKRAWKIMY